MIQQVFANHLEECDKPLAARPPEWGGAFAMFEPDASKPSVPGRLSPQKMDEFLGGAELAMLFLPSLGYMDDIVLKERARQASLVTMLAARIYKARQGAWPNDLRALIDEELLRSIPDDPFSAKAEPMRYRVDDGEMLIWSRGPNGVDDSGFVDNKDLHGPSTDVGMRVPRYRELPADMEDSRPM